MEGGAAIWEAGVMRYGMIAAAYEWGRGGRCSDDNKWDGGLCDLKCSWGRMFRPLKRAVGHLWRPNPRLAPGATVSRPLRGLRFRS